MTTKDTTVPNDHGARTLLAELEAAERNFNEVAAIVGKATDNLSVHKGSLNEQQFGQKLEAASADVTRAQEVIAQQNKLRTSYMGARVALFCTFSKLVRARDKFVRTVNKIAATFPAMHKDCPTQAELLGTRALEAVTRCDDAYTRALQRREKEWDRDLTEGHGVKALADAYHALIEKGINNHVPVYQDPLLFLTPLAGADLTEYRFCDAALNDQVVTIGNTISDLMQNEEFRLVWNFYNVNKGALNEKQFRARLAGYIEAKNEAAIGVVKNQQQHARIQFLTSRSGVTELYRKVAELVAQLKTLNDQLAEKLKGDLHVGANYKLAVMNNIIAANAIIRRFEAQQAKWNEELTATAEIASTSTGSLIERLREELSQEPYRSLHWTYHRDGTYTEPL